MDPVSAISLAGSVVGIVDVISRILVSLQAARERWETADCTVTLLIAQLSTLKAALNQVATWISSRLAGAPQHHQLIIDLDLSLSSCNTLISCMDRRISELDWNRASELSFRSKLLVVLGDKATKDLQNHLNSQTNALNIILNTFTCCTLSDQKNLLETEQSRQVFQQIKDASSSLAVLHDSASLLSTSSKTTKNSSKLSMRFMFDGELLQSKVYQGTIRFLLRRAIHGATTTASTTEHSNVYRSPDERKQMNAKSRQIDKILNSDNSAYKREVRVLVHGRRQSGKSTICKILELADSPEDIRSSLYALPLQDPTRLINETKFPRGEVIWSCIEQTNSYCPCSYPRKDVESTPCKKSDVLQLLGFTPQLMIFVVDLSSVDPGMEPVAASKEMQESVLLFEFTWRRTSEPPYPVLVFHKIDTLLEKLGPGLPDVRAVTAQIIRDLSAPFFRITKCFTVWSCRDSSDGGNLSLSRLGMASVPRQIFRRLEEAIIESHLDDLLGL